MSLAAWSKMSTRSNPASFASRRFSPRRSSLVAAPIAISALLLSLASSPLPAEEKHPLDLPHFYQVTPNVYRGAQPSPDEFSVLADLGIRTVINLRSTGSRIEKERRIVEGLGMRYVSIPLHGYQTPPDQLIRQALGELDTAGQIKSPVFVHCRLGKDRTGTVIACFRMAKQGWTYQAAFAEARKLGMNRLQTEMRSYLKDFSETVRSAD